MYNLFKYLKEVENREIPFNLTIKLYYEDKTLIENKNHLEILDISYKWLEDFLGTNLDDFEIDDSEGGKSYMKNDEEVFYFLKYDKVVHLNKTNFYLLFKNYMINCGYGHIYWLFTPIIYNYLKYILELEVDNLFVF